MINDVSSFVVPHVLMLLCDELSLFCSSDIRNISQDRPTSWWPRKGIQIFHDHFRHTVVNPQSLQRPFFNSTATTVKLRRILNVTNPNGYGNVTEHHKIAGPNLAIRILGYALAWLIVHIRFPTHNTLANIIFPNKSDQRTFDVC